MSMLYTCVFSLSVSLSVLEASVKVGQSETLRMYCVVDNMTYQERLYMSMLYTCVFSESVSLSVLEASVVVMLYVVVPSANVTPR